MVKIDFKENLVNFSSSLLKKYGVKPFHSSINKIDALLKTKKKIIVILMDGMGDYILNQHKDVSKKLLDNSYIKITSIYPPTTVAATTALLSGKFPGETGYLGWSLPIHNFSKNIDVFTNCDTQTGQRYDLSDSIYNLCPYQNIIELINKQNKKEIAKGVFRFPIDKKGPKSFSSFLSKIRKEAKTHELIYGYFNEPDHTIHEFGVNSKQAKQKVKKYVNQIVNFAKRNKNLLIITIADHGLIDINPIFINDYPDLRKLLSLPHSIEPRTPNFKIIKGKEKEFEILFEKYLGEHFTLIKNDKIEENHIFSPNKINEKAKQFLGDYIAIAKDNSALIFEGGNNFKAHHGGNTIEEMFINISVFNKE